MTRHRNKLIVESEPRTRAVPGGIQPRHGRQRAGFFHETGQNGQNGQKQKSKPRWSMEAREPTLSRDPPKPPMRVLLRNAKTREYFRSGQRWTKDRKQARDFRKGWWAAVHAFNMNPDHLVIEYEFDDDRYNLDIPVRELARS